MELEKRIHITKIGYVIGILETIQKNTMISEILIQLEFVTMFVPLADMKSRQYLE